MNERMFRTNIIGGYNKDDVRYYVESLEKELEQLKGKGKTFQPAADALQAQAEDDTLILDGGQGAANENVPAAEEKSPADKELKVGKEGETSKELALEKERAQKLEQRTAELEKELAEARDSVRQLEAELEKTRALKEHHEKNSRIAQLEKEKLEMEVKQLNEERKNYEDDYKAVKSVLLDARVDAEIIVAKARKKADLLLEDTERQMVLKQREIMNNLISNLAENNNKLTVSKYYLEEQVKGLEKTQKQIQEIQDNVELYLIDSLKKDTENDGKQSGADEETGSEEE